MVDAMTAIWLQTPKAAAAKPRPVQPRTPTTPAEESSDSSSEGVSEVSGESQLEGEGVAESIGVLRSLGTEPCGSPGHHPGVWNTCVAAPGVSRSCCCSCGRKECRSRRIFGHSGWNSSGYIGDGAANSGGNRAEEPGKPGISYLRPGRLVEKTLLASDWFDGTLASWSTPRHVLPQPPPPPSKSSPAPPSQSPPVPAQGQTQQTQQ